MGERQPVPEGLAVLAPGAELAGALADVDLSWISAFDCVEVLKARYRQKWTFSRATCTEAPGHRWVYLVTSRPREVTVDGTSSPLLVRRPPVSASFDGGDSEEEVEMLAVRAGRGFDGEREIPGGVVVLVDGGRITAVQPATTPLPQGWPVAEFPDATVLPGLIDMHVHLCGDSRDGALDRLPGLDADELDTVIDEALRRHLAAGVTTVRDLGDRRWAVLERRDRAAGSSGNLAPTIVASGPPVTSPRGHCWHMGGEVDGPEQLRAAVAERGARGVEVVKVMASGGALTAGTDVTRCQFSLDELRLLVDEAHHAGLPVTAHAHGLPAIEQAIEAGVDGIEHCTCLTESGVQMSEALLDSLAARRVVVCPTLGQAADATPPPIVLALMERLGLTWEDRQQHVGRMHRAGVRIVSGSDGGVSSGKPHGILPDAIADLVAGGVRPCEALASATSAAAQECGLGARKGLLRAGHDGDLLLVDGDPFRDIAALRRPAAVLVHGQWVDLPARPVSASL